MQIAATVCRTNLNGFIWVVLVQVAISVNWRVKYCRLLDPSLRVSLLELGNESLALLRSLRGLDLRVVFSRAHCYRLINHRDLAVCINALHAAQRLEPGHIRVRECQLALEIIPLLREVRHLIASVREIRAKRVRRISELGELSA